MGNLPNNERMFDIGLDLMPFRRLTDLKTTDFSAPQDDNTVALIPVGAVEQHGPHMPLGTDMILASAFAQGAAEKTKSANVILYPVQSLGASQEHHDFAGTIWLEPEVLIPTLMAIGRGVAAAGLKKVVFLNAHGGNIPALQIVCRKLRVERNLFAAAAGWMSFGMPDYPQETRRDDIHGGFMETSVMMHLRPDLVDADLAEDFVPHSRTVAQDNTHLRVLGPMVTGWVARDLHPSGAAGNAA
ncbi:MAG: creatininase family protein, partial [Sulfitobacter sp.]